MSWNYIEKNGQPKENGEYLVSVIAEKWLVDSGDCPERYTTYAYWDNEMKEWHNGEGYEYDVYAWTNIISPATPLTDRDWKYFCIGTELVWKKLYEYIKENNFKFLFDTPPEDFYYADVDIFCVVEEEEEIEKLINKWEEE